MSMDQDRQMEEIGDRPMGNTAPKKEYHTPQVTVHGKVAEITQAVVPFIPDGVLGVMFSMTSDQAVKQDFAAVDPHEILVRLAAIPVESWSYQFQDASVRHIGPMAQDFSAAFGVGESDRRISMVDANGVSIAAIQALYHMIQERDAQLDLLRAELNEIKNRLPN